MFDNVNGNRLSAVEYRSAASMSLDFFARSLHARTADARLPLRQLGFLVGMCRMHACRCMQGATVD